MKQINVIHIHGIGGDKKHSHDKIIKKLRKKLGDKVVLNVFPVNYLTGINLNQDLNFDRMIKAKGGKYMRPFKKIRKLFLNSFGDALTIFADKSTYLRTTAQIEIALRDSLENYSDVPTIVLSHSLGCQLFSCFMWDSKKRESNITQNIVSWFSYGNNMRGFFHGRYPTSIIPFEKPTSNFKWINFYSWSDILLGYTMRGINTKYDTLLTKDIQVKGFPFLSHSAYNKNKKVIKTIAEEILKI